jgi:monofunctional biosynthetic peptidoglycan transglycosylase
VARSRSSRSSRRNARIIVIAVAAIVLLSLVFWISLPDVRRIAATNPTTTTMIDLRREQAKSAGRAYKLHWDWRPMARISPLLQRAVVYAEDAQFWKHDGVDWEAMKDAAEHDWKERSLERGASTITQQVAKNLYLSPSRNPVRKLRELFIARRLDHDLGKKRVLELYLNIAEWGDGIFGAEAAARHWFGCGAAELRPAQAARLAVALPNPIKRSPAVKSRTLARRAERLVRAMARAGLIDAAALAEAQRELGVAPAATASPAATTNAATTANPAATTTPLPSLPRLPADESVSDDALGSDED